MLAPTGANDQGDDVRGLYDLGKPINIWRWRGGGQGGNNFDLSSGLAYETPAGTRGRWRDINNVRRPAQTSLTGQVMEGSDVILVTKLSEPLGIRLADSNVRGNSELTIAHLNDNTIPTGQVVLVGDCNAADLFVHTGAQQSGATGSFTRGNSSDLRITNALSSGLVWQKNWDYAAEVRFVESTLYFIGTGTSGLPALFKLDIGNGLGTNSTPAQPLEIVDGIEFMRAVVGADSNEDNIFDQYVRIDGVGDIGNARNLQIGMLAVGSQNTDIESASARTFQLTQRHQVTSPVNLPDNAAVTDTRYRQATTTTVELRNAGLSRTPQVFN